MQHFGIDFGTTNSATAGYYLGNVTLFDGGGGMPFPSVIAIDKMTGEVAARGRKAREHLETLGTDNIVISSVKSFLGTDTVWNIGPRTWTPTEVASEVFKGLSELVYHREQTVLKQAMVSIPVGFSPLKRRELRKAAKMAGLEISGFVSEPTAAVFKNQHYLASRQKIAVFDWGGGTLDLAVVDISGGLVTELFSKGIQVGGDDLDEKIARWVHQKITSNVGSESLAFDEMESVHKDQLLVKAESLKRSLSEVNEGKVLLYDYGPYGDKMVKVSREDVLEILIPEIDQVIAELDNAIKKARMSPKEIGCILMVGGSSKLLGLYEKMLENFETDILRPQEDADWNMAQGAAMLEADHGSEVLSCNLGLELSDGSFFPLLVEGASIQQGNASMRFGIVEDTETAMFVFREGTSNASDAIQRNLTRVVGYLPAAAFGFSNEPIVLKTIVDENLLFSATARSTRMGETRERTWEYENLKFKYKLPDGGQK